MVAESVHGAKKMTKGAQARKKEVMIIKITSSVGPSFEGEFLLCFAFSVAVIWCLLT